MKHFALFIGVAAALVASCSVQEDFFEGSREDTVLFYASFERPAQDGTKVYVNEDLHLRWTAGDCVSIFDQNTYNQQYKFLGETGDNSGEFAKVEGADFVTGNPIANVVSVYPYQESAEILENEVLTLTLPAEQHFADKSFGPGANTMVSVSADNFLQFKNLGGYLRLSIYGRGLTVSSIVLKGNNGEKLAGTATVTMPLDETPTATLEEDATDEISLICDTPFMLGNSADASIDFWFVVPPVTFEKGFSIKVIDDKGRVYEKSTSKSISIERNRLTKMESFGIDASAPSGYEKPIAVDGDFSDWNLLDADWVATAECAQETSRPALERVKVYADEQFIFVYFEWDKDLISYADYEWVPFECFVNTDGDSSTGGYADGFLDACSDVLVEGVLYPNGVLGSYNAYGYAWSGEPNGEGWEWSDFELVKFTQGAGVDGKYELQIDRAFLASFGFPVADEFSIGFAILQYWDAVGLLPNSDISDSNPNGIAPSLQVKTVPFTL
ncbi:MAG: hypothetical protein IKP01_07870 [Bacteroidales bacterium]|nr:hypothetical protein [Bacteroidales bacterium]MBR4688216.1 hypothetical protein [Bacteroidales bacterium]